MLEIKPASMNERHHGRNLGDERLAVIYTRKPALVRRSMRRGDHGVLPVEFLHIRPTGTTATPPATRRFNLHRFSAIPWHG
ncbi:hypothetical protein [Kitasatospora sp. NPDC058190]|uniref:hypothetical protein n=1 Tax=Kitasatospora sp. NPDC058190 TaxID=3346371 RepID=UPI0036D99F39